MASSNFAQSVARVLICLGGYECELAAFNFSKLRMLKLTGYLNQTYRFSIEKYPGARQIFPD